MLLRNFNNLINLPANSLDVVAFLAVAGLIGSGTNFVFLKTASVVCGRLAALGNLILVS